MPILRLIVFLLFFLGCSTNKKVVNQTVDEKNVKQKIKELNKKQIDYLLLKKYYTYFGFLNSVNRNENCNDCSSNTFYYIIWKEKSENYIQKFDKCGFFYPKKLINSSIIDFYNSNFEDLKNEDVKMYEIGNGKVSFEMHTELRDFILKKNQNLIHKNFDILYLTTNEEMPNLNYEYNNNLKLIELNKLIANEIKINDSLKLFKRDYSTCK